VHVPYGSILVRPTTLFHGGHYGNPGNARFHGSLVPIDSTIDDVHLGYLYDAVAKVPELREWRMVWDKDQVKDDIRLEKAKAGRKNWLPKFNEGIKDSVNKGLAYHDEYIHRRDTFLRMNEIFKNLNPRMGNRSDNHDYVDGRDHDSDDDQWFSSDGEGDNDD
jgi:hypothetical protein